MDEIVVVSRLSSPSPAEPEVAPASSVCGSGSDPSLSYEPPGSTFAGALTHEPPTTAQPAWTTSGAAAWTTSGRALWTTAAAVSRPERRWAMAAHLSGPLAALSALGFLGPLVVLLVAGNRSPFVRRHAVEALNFNLTALVATVVSGLAVLLVVGIPLLIVVAIGYLVGTIAATVAASTGSDYRHRFALPFVR